MYQLAEKFKSIQGEGVYAGTPMAFVRFVGCSVGKKVCNACDTDFEKMHAWRGGGEFSSRALEEWAKPYRHLCLTGGEPFDQDLEELIAEVGWRFDFVHIETSGTVGFPEQLRNMRYKLWICVSPKPGFREDMIELADEIKIIVPGLGAGEGWPTLEQAVAWKERSTDNKPIFLQPRNSKHGVDPQNLQYVLDLLREYPQFRLSTQLHKILKVQ